MSAVELQILEPVHDSGFVGNVTVTCQGTIARLPDELQGVPLYFRWYSSLFAAPEGEADRYSINPSALTSVETSFEFNPGVGTQVVCLAVGDQAGETSADMEATQHGGVAGGSEGDGKCIIHVFQANLILPVNLAAISRANTTLEAQAPSLWGKPGMTVGTYELNPDYHALNRLQYRWQFVPVGAPFNRETIDFVPDVAQWNFDPEVEPVRIRYQGPLPSALTGNYTLTLHVEDKDSVLGGHEQSIAVQVVP